jgi:hypothetical protein
LGIRFSDPNVGPWFSVKPFLKRVVITPERGWDKILKLKL